jgi:16S rRNA (uracil1498-N3)-methyltransferase
MEDTMYQFFVGNDQVHQNQIEITGSDVNHIGNVLRMKPGENVRVSDASGQAYFCHITKITSDEVRLAIDFRDELGTEFGHRVVLFQGLPKGDKMELIIQKSVELGAAEIVPVAMKNCVVKLDAKKAESKCKRWQAIAESAAKQSKRSVIPVVHAPVSWREACDMAGQLDVTLVPYEKANGLSGTRQQISTIKDGASIGVMIGPEGGFAPEEIALTEERERMQCISLGRRILRAETAGPATLAMLVYELDI